MTERVVTSLGALSSCMRLVGAAPVEILDHQVSTRREFLATR
ncbi:MAG: hypothetical protein WBC76_09575 [Actinomycetes bacterium]